MEGIGRKAGGKGGIRTPGTVTRTRDFQSRTFGHSVTFPRGFQPEWMGFKAPNRAATLNVNFYSEQSDLQDFSALQLSEKHASSGEMDGTSSTCHGKWDHL